MRKLLNTLFVTTPGTYLFKDGETIAVKLGEEVKLRLPIHTIGGVICFDQVNCSPHLMGFCAENDVAISFISEYGGFQARVLGYMPGNVLLRRQQYRWADDEKKCVEISKFILTGKFANCRAVLQRVLRDHAQKIDEGAISKACERIAWSIKELSRPLTLEELRGLEGDTAHTYFGVFDHLIIAQKEHFIFQERNRRPPLDNVNCLLSFLYTLLMHDVRSALESVGLDSAVGFLHRDRPGRPSLALDLMEEMRPFFADRLALSLINLSQVNSGGFKKTETGAVLMTEEARKSVLVAYQNRKQEEITHPYLNEKIKVGLMFYVQALLMARYVRGDLDGYPPFIWR